MHMQVNWQNCVVRMPGSVTAALQSHCSKDALFQPITGRALSKYMCSGNERDMVVSWMPPVKLCYLADWIFIIDAVLQAQTEYLFLFVGKSSNRGPE